MCGYFYRLECRLDLVVASVSAQEITGVAKGNIALTAGLGFDNYTKVAGLVTTKHTDIFFSPSAMYMIQDKWGIRGGISYVNQKTETAGVSASTSLFGFDAGARYFFTPANRLSFYLDGGINGSFPTGVTNIGVNFNPGFHYFIHNNWSLGANLNLLSLNISAPSGGDATTMFRVNPVTNITDFRFTLMYVIKPKK